MASARIPLTISLVDGSSFNVVAGAKAIVDAERHFNKPLAQLFNQDSMSYESICWLAWRACQLSNRVVKPFDEWLGEIDSVEGTEDQPNPLGTP
jgi:hypothetical protein